MPSRLGGGPIVTSSNDVNTAAVRSLIASEDPLPDDGLAMTGWMQRLCRAAARTLPAMGAGVSLMSGTGSPVAFVASGPRCEQLEELQFTLGEGPCMDAYGSRKPVLTSDLAEAGSRWPGYAPAVSAHGVQAVFALPLQIGAACLGAMDIYRSSAGALTSSELAVAFAFTEVAMGALLDAQDGSADGFQVDSFQREAASNRFEVYQAQGMVTVQLGVNLAEAMARLRAYAYAEDCRLADVADAVIEGKLVFDPGDP